MNVLITGNMGYVGPVLVEHLRRTLPGVHIAGFDSGYFAHCLTAPRLPETGCDVQHFGDVRRFPAELLDGVDAVVLLAAISNDPMGQQYEAVTEAINHQACVAIAREALTRGVSNVVFASSCSMYGAAAGAARKEQDTLNPLTAYARSKVATERDLAALASDAATVTSLRFSTACGMSPRLRLDLVLNDFVACARVLGEIVVLSDGSPWRPLIDVRDMARAIEWALVRDPADAGQYVAVNVGSDAWNYQVRDLAHAVAAAFPNTRISINPDAPPDKRSYSVDFALYRQIAPDHQPQVTLHQSIAALREGLAEIGFADPDFRTSPLMRLKTLERHRAAGRLDANLDWQDGSCAD